MLIGIPAEKPAGESRIAATAETVKKLVAAKHEVLVESGAGVRAAQTDEALRRPGRRSSIGRRHSVRRWCSKYAPSGRRACIVLVRRGAGGHARALQCRRDCRHEPGGADCVRARSCARTTRAAEHRMCCPRRANIAGYKAVLLASAEYGRMMPMMMTAAAP